jgi:hypothetical protein
MKEQPLESMTDALGFFPATDVLLATPPEEESYWLERDLPEKARALTAVPVQAGHCRCEPVVPPELSRSSRAC